MTSNQHIKTYIKNIYSNTVINTDMYADDATICKNNMQSTTTHTKCPNKAHLHLLISQLYIDR